VTGPWRPHKQAHADAPLRYRVPVASDPSSLPAGTSRRLVILAEGAFAVHSAKTAMGVLRYSPDRVTAVIDSSQAGRNVREWLGDAERFDVPVVASLAEALARGPADALLIGIAPTGGRLPAEWRATILEAIEAGLDVLSGLHMFVGDDP
jgi:uncharacterized NAD-dependent epimerase/dehydratase family protein